MFVNKINKNNIFSKVTFEMGVLDLKQKEKYKFRRLSSKMESPEHTFGVLDLKKVKPNVRQRPVYKKYLKKVRNWYYQCSGPKKSKTER
jgi:hypothetical protein